MQICTLANSQHVSKSEWRLCSAGMTRVKQNDKVIIFSSVGKAVLTAQLKPPECHDKMCSISNVPKLKKMCALKLTNWRFWCTVFVQQMTLQGTRMNSTTHTHTHTHILQWHVLCMRHWPMLTSPLLLNKVPRWGPDSERNVWSLGRSSAIWGRDIAERIIRLPSECPIKLTTSSATNSRLHDVPRDHSHRCTLYSLRASFLQVYVGTITVVGLGLDVRRHDYCCRVRVRCT